MTLSLKHLKIIIISLAVALTLFAGWSIYTSADYNKKKAEFEQGKLEREVRIRVLTAEKEEAKAKAKLSAVAAEVAAKERDSVKSELVRAYKKQEENVEEIENMEPDELVRVTWRLLKMGMEDIYRNPEGVQFSLAATKRLTIDLTYLDFYLNIEKPKLIKSDKKAKEEATYWHEAYATLSEGALKDAEGLIVELTAQVVEDDRQLKRAEKRIKQASFKATVKTVIAVGVGYAVVRWVVIPLFGGK
jgi:hypothetical protein